MQPLSRKEAGEGRVTSRIYYYPSFSFSSARRRIVEFATIVRRDLVKDFD